MRQARYLGIFWLLLGAAACGEAAQSDDSQGNTGATGGVTAGGAGRTAGASGRAGTSGSAGGAGGSAGRGAISGGTSGAGPASGGAGAGGTPGTAGASGASFGGASGASAGGAGGNAAGSSARGGNAGSVSGGAGLGASGTSAGTGGRGGASSAGSGGTGGSGSCTEPPVASPLVGWAAVSGKDVTTTTGGGTTAPITVTTLADFTNAVKGTNAAVIYVKGTLSPGKVNVGSNKTIVGLCGAEVHGHVELSGSVNVIVRNLKLVGYGVGNCSLDPDYDSGEGCSSGNDAISVQKDAHHIWFDHCDISDGTDGNLDITNGADYVTVSWTRFHYSARTDTQGSDSTGASGHRYSNLIGGTDSPSYDDANSLNVTWHHNHWADRVVERQPRVRFGRNHLYNNLWSSADSNYCVRAGKQARILIENGVFEGVRDPFEFNSDGDKANASITASGNDYTDSSGTKDDDGGGAAIGTLPYAYTADPVNTVAAAVRSGVGPK